MSNVILTYGQIGIQQIGRDTTNWTRVYNVLTQKLTQIALNENEIKQLNNIIDYI